jgi:hypothetical protein
MPIEELHCPMKFYQQLSGPLDYWFDEFDVPFYATVYINKHYAIVKYIDFVVLLRKSSCTNRKADDPWDWWEFIMEIGYERIEEFKELVDHVTDIFINENANLQWKRKINDGNYH